MLERHWPWLVSVAAPALAAMVFVAWFAVAPRGLESFSAAHSGGNTALESYVLGAFSARDLDGSKGLDLQEFVSAASEELKRRQEALFHGLDLNGDGVISADEYREQLLALTVLPARGRM